MIIYDLANHLLQSTTIECLRYSNAKQSVVVRIVGTVPTASYWQAAIALSTRLIESEILARNEAADVAISGNDITIKFKTSTNNWLTATSECPNGVRAWMVLRPFDSVGEEMDYVRVPVMVFPVVDPTGIMPPPSEVTANYVVTLNGAGGNLTIKDSTGAALSVTNNVIQLTKAAIGLSHVQNILDNLTATAAPTATDDSTKGYSKKSQWIYDGKFYTCIDPTVNAAIWTEGGAGDVTAAGDNAFLGENSFAEPITIAGNAVTGLIEDRSQITWPSVVDEKYDRCRYFDATFDVLNFVSMQVRVKQMRMVVVSANPTYTGNVVYVPYTASDKTFADQVAGDPIVVAVGATPDEVVFDLVVDKKFLRLVRDYSNVFDTLKDDTSTPITAIVPFYSVEVSNERPVA